MLALFLPVPLCDGYICASTWIIMTPVVLLMGGVIAWIIKTLFEVHQEQRNKDKNC